MSLYEMLLIVPAILVVIALGMVVLAFVQYTPGEIFRTVGLWFKANALALGLYAGALVLLAVFLV
ncbi:hypothetical protein [Thiomicrospira pelophila]|uniref:hypothetical protein n=1 Tax=Thiomicrospira pelophila TaxID=934 RepID=UPI0004A73D81|nr:hypothetical protein [Thiomicrospira pelophila]